MMANIFDEMLDNNRRAFDKLFGADWLPSGRLSSLAHNSETLQRLNDRYRKDWRFEVLEQRRDGDEIIVLATLSIPSKNQSVTQTGRARIGQPDESNDISGTVDGIPFAIRSNNPPSYPGISAEQAAVQKATEVAAANCAKWI